MTNILPNKSALLQPVLFFYDSCDFSKKNVEESIDWHRISACLRMGLTVVVHCSQQDQSPIVITFLASFNSKELASGYANDIGLGSDESAWVDIVWPENHQA